jgi:hypothetical protein
MYIPVGIVLSTFVVEEGTSSHFMSNVIHFLAVLGYVKVTNTLIKTTVRNKYLFVLDFIVHYYNMFRPRSVAIFR